MLAICSSPTTLRRSPASLQGVHVATGDAIEVRLAGRPSLRPEDMNHFTAVVFGAGDFHTRTEDRLPPPKLCGRRQDHSRTIARYRRAATQVILVLYYFDLKVLLIMYGRGWRIMADQSSTPTLRCPSALWDVWTRIAGPPVAFEPPSAGFALDWHALSQMRERGIEFETITHAAGISSTGDEELDRLLPLDEPYRIPEVTARAIQRTKDVAAASSQWELRLSAHSSTLPCWTARRGRGWNGNPTHWPIESPARC